MTNKQIIIDDQKKTIHRLQDECTKKTDTIIALGEKLKAKEQACKALAVDARVADNHLQHRIEMCDLLREKLKAKEQECEELKKQHQSDKGLITSIGKMNYQLLQEYDKLKTVLTEIKEIAEKIDDSDGCAYGDYDCDNCSSLEQETVCTYKVKKLILQKISEVEDES